MAGIGKIKLPANTAGVNPSKLEIGSRIDQPSFKQVMEKSLKKLDQMWSESQSKLTSAISKVPEEYKNAFQAQILVSNCNFQVELVTKVADGVQASVKKLQSQNG